MSRRSLLLYLVDSRLTVFFAQCPRNGLPWFVLPYPQSSALLTQRLFAGVTTVLQVGLPANAEQYIHRFVLSPLSLFLH